MHICIMIGVYSAVTDEEKRVSLLGYGQYIHECLPKFVQQTQVNGVNELEILIHPEGDVSLLDVTPISLTHQV